MPNFRWTNKAPIVPTADAMAAEAEAQHVGQIKLRKTDRGFSIGEFTDRYDNPCSIQKSSLAFERCIWLGVSEAETETGPRMHLTQQMVADLLPLLQRFVDTGEID